MNHSAVVSFCIPTYNRKDMVIELVLNILSSSRQDIEVVVMDNCSTDDTIAALKSISDLRLKIYEHSHPVSAFKSWYDTLSKGTGDWIFHVNDRDWIDSSKIDLLAQSLRELSILNVGFAVAGEKISPEQPYKIYDEGLSTLCEFAMRFSHPTGQIIKKTVWDSIRNKEEFFNDELYGDYPHGYLYAIIGNHKKGAYLLFDICDKAHYKERVVKTFSTVYATRTNKKEWFLPESRYNLLTLAAVNIHLIENPAFYKLFILDRYVKFFYAVTSEWYNTCNNSILKMRYNRTDLETNYLSLMTNGFDYINLFREYLENNDFDWADKEFYNNLINLDCQLVKWLLEWTESLRSQDSNI